MVSNLRFPGFPIFFFFKSLVGNVEHSDHSDRMIPGPWLLSFLFEFAWRDPRKYRSNVIALDLVHRDSKHEL